jgi:hypothetical protein
MAALTSARMQFDAGDLKTARAQLQWVAEKAGDKDLRDLGRLRLAHVLFDDKASDEALKLLSRRAGARLRHALQRVEGRHAGGTGQEGRGPRRLPGCLGRQEAATRPRPSGGRDTQYRDLLQIKLDSLGDK